MKYKSNSGFTLVELIVATLIFVIIAGLIAVFTAYYFNNYTFSFEENQTVGQTQTALTSMVREIREIRIGEDGAWPISEAGNNNFTFYSDVTNDGRADKIRYFLDGSMLKKGVIQPTDVPVSYPAANEKIYLIANYIDNDTVPVFRYYNGNWPQDQLNNPLSPAGRVFNTRFVKIYLRLNIQTNSGSLPFELTYDVQIRSMKDNL